MTSQIDDVNNLLKSNKGDTGRLEYIKNTLEQNKTLYASDREYLQNLTEQYFKDKIQENPNKISYNDKFIEDKPVQLNQNDSFCGKCGKKFNNTNNFCPNCGSSKNNQHTSTLEQNFNPRPTQNISKQDHTGIKSYQILSVIGGALGLLVTLVYVFFLSLINSITSSVGSGFDESTSRYFFGAIPLVVIIYISCFIIPFVIKKTKIVGIYLIMSAIVVILASTAVGIPGFALLLPAGIIALRRK